MPLPHTSPIVTAQRCVVDLEHVVEVAADQAGRAGRPVTRRDLGAGRWLQHLWQQAELQRLGDGSLLVVQPLVVLRQTRAPRGGATISRRLRPATVNDGGQTDQQRRSTTGGRTARC